MSGRALWLAQCKPQKHKDKYETVSWHLKLQILISEATEIDTLIFAQSTNFSSPLHYDKNTQVIVLAQFFQCNTRDGWWGKGEGGGFRLPLRLLHWTLGQDARHS